MSKLNLEVNLHELTPNQSNALAAFVTTFGGFEAPYGDTRLTEAKIDFRLPETTAEQPTEEKKTRKPRGSKVQAGAFEGQERTESHVDNYEAAKEVEVKEAETVSAADDDIMGEDSLTFDDIRALTSKITQESKEGLAALKGKLSEYGCAKLVDLKDKPELWQAFYSFAESLK